MNRYNFFSNSYEKKPYTPGYMPGSGIIPDVPIPDPTRYTLVVPFFIPMLRLILFGTGCILEIDPAMKQKWAELINCRNYPILSIYKQIISILYNDFHLEFRSILYTSERERYILQDL